MKSTKFFAALLAVMMIFGTFAASAAGFNDLDYDKNPEQYKKVVLLSEMGILQGDDHGNANLDKHVTRAEMAAFIFRTGTTYTDIKGGLNTTTFTDIPEGAWYTSNVVWCAENGIINGRSKEVFDPQADVSYDEAIKMACTLVGYKNLSYPLGYQLKFLDILKESGLTMKKAFPNYKADVVGTRYPINRGEVVDLLNIALRADLPDKNGRPTGATLLSTKWGESAIKKYNVIVVKESFNYLPEFKGVANPPVGKVAVCPVKNNTFAGSVSDVYVLDAKELGLPGDNIGTALTYYTMVKEGKETILPGLTGYVRPELAEDVSASYRTKDSVNYLTIDGYELKAADYDSRSHVFAYSNGIDKLPWLYKPVAGQGTKLFADLKAGRDVYVSMIDLFNDGTVDYFAYSAKQIAIYGEYVKEIGSSKSPGFALYTLNPNSMSTISAKRSTIKGYASILTPKYCETVNPVKAVENDFVTYFAFGGKYIIDEVIEPMNGTITKVANGSTFTIKNTADGSKADYTLYLGANGPLANGNVVTPAMSAALPATTRTNFLMYGSKIVAVYADEDAVPPAPVYKGNKLAIFYGLTNRDITFSPKYIKNPDGSYTLTYTPSFKYNAMIAYEDNPAVIVKVPVGIDTIGDKTSLDTYFNADLTGLVNSQAPADVSASAKVGDIATDGKAAVLVSVITADGANKGKYAITEDITLAQLSAGTKEVLVDGAYVAQNALTGYYELYDDSGKVIRTFTCDDETVIFNLTKLTADGKANKIDSISGKLASYKAAKATSFGSIVKKEAFMGFDSTALTADIVGNFIFEEGNGKSVLRKAVVAKDAAGAAKGQLIAKAADTTKAPYNFTILKSIDTISVENKTATVYFTVYNPALNKTFAFNFSKTGKSDAEAKSNLEAAINAELLPNVGKVISYNKDTKKWEGKDLASYAEALGFTAVNEGKNQNLTGNYFKAATKLLVKKGNDYFIGVDVSGTTVYFKVNANCNIFNFGAEDVKDTYFKSVAIKNDHKVLDKDGKYVLDTFSSDVTFFVDSAFNVVFGQFEIVLV